MILKLKDKVNRKKGFTIIELVITIFVLAIGVIGVFSSFSLIVVLASDSIDRFTATYLAQEGMEIIRNIRDTNWVKISNCFSESCPSWTEGLYCPSPSGCGVDFQSLIVNTAKGGDYLYLNRDGFYNYDISGIKTKFIRKIVTMPVTDVDGNSDHILKVIVQVSWDKKATIMNSFIPATLCQPQNCIEVKETLYNWYYHIYR